MIFYFEEIFKIVLQATILKIKFLKDNFIEFGNLNLPLAIC